MPETLYTSSQYYNLFFQLYFNGGLSFPLKSQENFTLVRTIQNLAKGQEKMEQDSKNFRLHLWLWQPSVMYEQFLIG